MSETDETSNPARYALFKAVFLKSEGRPQADAHRLIDEYAHELAEQIRNTPGPDDPDDYGGFVDMGADWAADLIDPNAGPVRPDEERDV